MTVVEIVNQFLTVCSPEQVLAGDFTEEVPPEKETTLSFPRLGRWCMCMALWNVCHEECSAGQRWVGYSSPQHTVTLYPINTCWFFSEPIIFSMLKLNCLLEDQRLLALNHYSCVGLLKYAETQETAIFGGGFHERIRPREPLYRQCMAGSWGIFCVSDAYHAITMQ